MATISTAPSETSPARGRLALIKPAIGAFLLATFALILLLAIVAVIAGLAGDSRLSGRVLALAIPAFIAGVLSILSPCSLPIVLGYFSVAFQEQRERISAITIAFLGGVGTTMAVLGASFTALGSFAVDHQQTLSLVGGLLVIGFGVMTLAGKGFGGLRLTRRPGFSVGGSFLYGLIFALGWTTCVGPILGSVLTLLIAEGAGTTTSLSLVAGAALSLIYVLGLGLPIFLLVLVLRSGGSSRDVTSKLRGRVISLSVAGHTLELHTTSIASGLVLIALGILLATGQMTAITQELAGSKLSQFAYDIEQWFDGLW